MIRQHPLENNWVFYFDKVPAGEKWANTHSKICEVATIEEFWSVYKRIAPPSRLRKGMYNYCFFRKGIVPRWDDPRLAGGGKLQFSLAGDADWKNAMLYAISQQYEGNIVAGVYLSIYPTKSRINIWLTTTDREQVTAIAQQLRSLISKPFFSSWDKRVKYFF